MSVRVPGLSFSLCKAPFKLNLYLNIKEEKVSLAEGGFGKFGESSVIHQTKLFK